MKKYFTILSVVLLSACNTIHYIGIETYNPAEITFPAGVNKVLIVNNALPQPPHIGYEYKLLGVVQDSCFAHTDSALYDACKALGESIVEREYFEDILLYHHPTRQDALYFSDVKLTQQQVKDLCEENDADAIISFDRLLFEMKRNITAFAEGYGFVVGLVDVKMGGVVRAYIPQRANPVATVLVSDSIYWSESAESRETLEKYLPKPDEALRTAGKYLGSRVYPNFVPHWENEVRWWYSGGNTRWKEASAYASTGKWDKAIPIWTQIYERSSGWKEKAKAASNLALANEVESNLQIATEWAQKSHDLFEKNIGSDGKETLLQKAYIETLEKRIRLDQKLNVQIGE